MTSAKCGVNNCKRDYDILCAHCQRNVCPKHYIEHVKLANDELVILADRVNFMINGIQQWNSPCKAFEKIEEWRKMKYRRIDRLCDEKKQQLTREIEQNVELQKTKLHKLGERVRELIDDGDASFKQIENLERDISECQKQCEQLDKVDYLCSDMTTNDTETISFNKELFTGGGTLLSLEQQTQLNKFYGKETQKWVLVYKATKNGFEAVAFHRCCDNQGPTMTIIRSKSGSDLFGGYASASWRSTESYIGESYRSFLFTLTNPHGIPPTKYPVLEANYSIYNQRDCGPTFGCGHDLYVCDDSKTKTGSYFDFPQSYCDTTNRGAETFTGGKYFQTNDIEVYRLMEN